MARVQRKRRNYGYGGTAKNIGRFAQTAYNMYQRYKRPYTSSSNARAFKRVKAEPGVTTQFDQKMIYRKRYMPKGKKLKWKNFVKKVQAVNLRDRGLTTVLFNGLYTFTASAVNNQALGEVHLYGFKTALQATAPGSNDIGAIIGSDWTLSSPEVLNNDGINGPQLGYDFSKKGTAKMMFESAVLDITISNNVSGKGIELDIYHIIYNPKNGVPMGSLVSAFTTSTNVGNVQGAVSSSSFATQLGFTLNNRGATPFELGKVISSYGVKILNKKKFLVPAGGSITHQIRDAKNRYVDASDFYNQTADTLKYRGFTQSLLVIAKNIDNSEGTSCSFKIGATRTYKYTVEGQKDDKAFRLDF